MLKDVLTVIGGQNYIILLFHFHGMCHNALSHCKQDNPYESCQSVQCNIRFRDNTNLCHHTFCIFRYRCSLRMFVRNCWSLLHLCYNHHNWEYILEHNQEMRNSH